jgi:uncharacterized protein YjiS (DUF1127 family)
LHIHALEARIAPTTIPERGFLVMFSKQTRQILPLGMQASGARRDWFLGRLLRPLAAGLRTWAASGRDRTYLASLDDRQLRDMGLDRRMVADESTTKYWRLR